MFQNEFDVRNDKKNTQRLPSTTGNHDGEEISDSPYLDNLRQSQMSKINLFDGIYISKNRLEDDN